MYAVYTKQKLMKFLNLLSTNHLIDDWFDFCSRVFNLALK